MPFDSASNTGSDPFGLPSSQDQSFGKSSSRSVVAPTESSALDAPITMSRWSIAGDSSGAVPDLPSAATVDAAEGSASDESAATIEAPAARPTSENGAGKAGDLARYELKRKLGRGGCGEVWEARQAALDRMVAVKRVRLDVLRSEESEESRERLLNDFRQEALTSAALEHPNIVPVHDIGLDPEGAPLLAMKLVRGRAWDQELKADLGAMSEADFLAKHLPTLASVAQATAFAHAKGVVHRDLKPAQVMTGEFGEVLLMDWGLAIHVEIPADDASIESTAARQDAPTRDNCSNPSGTPALMAPEQTRRDARDIGTWTDVYLLGATLYYLLTGTYPHQANNSLEAFEKAKAGNVEPPEKRSPRRAVPLELRDLAMKALADDPKERVASAKDFANAVKDFLSGASKRRESEELQRQANADFQELKRGRGLEASEAHRRHDAVAERLDRALSLWPENAPASRLRAKNIAARAEGEIARGDLILARIRVEELERLGDSRDPEAAEAIDVGGLRRSLDAAMARRTRARRQRLALAATAAFLLVASVGLGLKAREEGNRAALALLENERESAKREAAQARAAEQERLASLFSRVNAMREREQDLASRMERASPLPLTLRAGTEYPKRDSSSATMARLLVEREAVRRERAALATLAPEGTPLGAEPFPLLLGEANIEVAKRDNRDAALRAFALYEAASEARPDAAEPLVGMGVAAYRSGHLASAAQLLERAAKALGEAHPDFEKAAAMAGGAYQEIGSDSAKHYALYQQGVDALEPKWIKMTEALAERQQALGRPEEALAYFMEVLRLLQRNPEREKMNIATIKISLASSLQELDRYGDAEAAYREAIALLGELGDASPEDREFASGRLATANSRLGALLARVGRREEGIALMRESAALTLRAFGEESMERAEQLAQLGNALGEIAKFDEAEQLLREALRIFSAALEPGHPSIAAVHSYLGSLAYESTDFAAAEREFAIAMNLFEGSLTANHRSRAQTLANYASILWERGEYLEAKPMLEEAVRIYEDSLGSDNSALSHALTNLAAVCFSLQDTEAAVRYATRSFEIQKKALGERHPDLVLAMVNLATTYKSGGRFEESGEIHAAAAKLAREVSGDEHPDALMAYASYAGWLGSAGRDEEAVEWQRKAVHAARSAYGEESARYAHALGNLAHHLSRIGETREALELTRQAVDAMERAEPGDAPRVGEMLQALAKREADLGDFDAAEKTIRRAIALKSNAQDPTSAVMARAYLGDILAKKGKQDEAEELLLSAARELEEIQGPASPQAARVLMSAGTLQARRKKHDEAAQTLRRAIELARAAYGDNHEGVASGWSNLSIVLQNAGRPDEAVEATDKAIEIAAATLGENHPTYLLMLANSGETCRKLGMNEEAAERFRRVDAAYAERAASGGPMNDRMRSAGATALRGLALLSFERGDMAEAERLCLAQAEACEAAAAPFPGQESLWKPWGRALIDAGRAMAAQGKVEEAKEAWEAALQVAIDGPQTLQMAAIRAEAMCRLGDTQYPMEELLPRIVAFAYDDEDFLAFLDEFKLSRDPADYPKPSVEEAAASDESAGSEAQAAEPDSNAPTVEEPAAPDGE